MDCKRYEGDDEVSEHDELRKLADNLRDIASSYELSVNVSIQDLCMAIGDACDGIDTILSRFPDSPATDKEMRERLIAWIQDSGRYDANETPEAVADSFFKFVAIDKETPDE